MHCYIFSQYDLFAEIFKTQYNNVYFWAKHWQICHRMRSSLFLSCWDWILYVVYSREFYVVFFTITLWQHCIMIDYCYKRGYINQGRSQGGWGDRLPPPSPTGKCHLFVNYQTIVQGFNKNYEINHSIHFQGGGGNRRFAPTFAPLSPDWHFK